MMPMPARLSCGLMGVDLRIPHPQPPSCGLAVQKANVWGVFGCCGHLHWTQYTTRVLGAPAVLTSFASFISTIAVKVLGTTQCPGFSPGIDRSEVSRAPGRRKSDLYLYERVSANTDSTHHTQRSEPAKPHNNRLPRKASHATGGRRLFRIEQKYCFARDCDPIGVFCYVTSRALDNESHTIYLSISMSFGARSIDDDIKAWQSPGYS